MANDLSRSADRFIILLEKLWGGSQTKMAADIGISQSAISNVKTGRQQPGRNILAAAAAHPLVNGDWLLTGNGDPFPPLAAGVRALYVATSLFAGLPEDHPHCLGEMREVATRLYRPSRYWIRVEFNHPLAVGCPGILIGDHVLFDADENGWPNNIEKCPQIVEIGRGKKTQLICVTPGADTTSTAGIKRPGREQRSILLDKDDSESSPTRSPSPPRNNVKVRAVGIHREGGFDGMRD